MATSKKIKITIEGEDAKGHNKIAKEFQFADIKTTMFGLELTQEQPIEVSKYEIEQVRRAYKQHVKETKKRIKSRK